MSKKKPYYVDGKKFYADICEYHDFVEKEVAAGKERPKIPDHIIKPMMLIAERLSYSPKFVNYNFREDMVQEAIENCFVVFNNFNHNKYKNPFSYFTQVSYFAFLRRIQKEKKQLYVKHKVLENYMMTGQDDVEEEARISPSESEYMKEFITNFEKGLIKK